MTIVPWRRYQRRDERNQEDCNDRAQPRRCTECRHDCSTARLRRQQHSRPSGRVGPPTCNQPMPMARGGRGDGLRCTYLLTWPALKRLAGTYHTNSYAVALSFEGAPRPPPRAPSTRLAPSPSQANWPAECTQATQQSEVSRRCHKTSSSSSSSTLATTTSTNELVGCVRNNEAESMLFACCNFDPNPALQIPEH